MNTEPKLPSSWGRFERVLAPLEPHYDYQKVFDFQARWRFATSFVRVEAEGYSASSKIAEGYYVLLRILLVCTAREQLVQALGLGKHYNAPIHDPVLARRIREVLHKGSSTKFAKALQKSNTPRSKDWLASFWKGENDDINQFAFAIRNGVAHGTLTPSGLQLDISGRTELLKDLADEVLLDADRLFTAWVEGEIARRIPDPS